MKGYLFFAILIGLFISTAKAGCGIDTDPDPDEPWCEGKVLYVIGGTESSSLFKRGNAYLRLNVTDESYFWADSTYASYIIALGTAAASLNMDVSIRFTESTTDGKVNTKRITWAGLKAY